MVSEGFVTVSERKSMIAAKVFYFLSFGVANIEPTSGNMSTTIVPFATTIPSLPGSAPSISPKQQTKGINSAAHTPQNRAVMRSRRA
jgi:hypothetical protein